MPIPESRYKTAADVRAQTVGDIAFNKYSAGESGVMGSYAQATREKLAARSVGLKEKFDPLNIVQGLTGSRLLTAAAGKALGRKSEDVSYFTDKAANKRDQARPDAKKQETADKVSEYEKKYYDNVLSGKTILYPKDDSNGVVNKLQELIDLVDERLIGGGMGRLNDSKKESSRYIPGKETSKDSSGSNDAMNIAEGAAGSTILSKALQYGKNFFNGGASAAEAGAATEAGVGAAGVAEAGVGAAGVAEAGAGAGTVAEIAAAAAIPEAVVALGGTAVVAAPLIASGLAGRDKKIKNDATPSSLPNEALKNKKFEYLKDLTTYDPTPYLDLNYGNGNDQDAEQLSKSGDQFIKSFINKVPGDDKAAFNQMIEKQVLPIKDPNEKMAAFAQFINRYAAEKIRSPNTMYKGSGGLEAATRERDATRLAKAPREDREANASGQPETNTSILETARASGGKFNRNIGRNNTAVAASTVAANLDTLQATRQSGAEQPTQPIIVNAGGGGGSSAPAPAQSSSSGAAPNATTDGTTNRFENKLMGDHVGHLP